MNNIHYSINKPITATEYIDLINTTTMAKMRPIDQPKHIEQILKNSNLVVTARLEGRLVGIARSITDTHNFSYLSDLAVHADYQKQSIGSHLIDQVQQQLGETGFIFLGAYPEAMNYYPKIGFIKADAAWILPKGQNIDAQFTLNSLEDIKYKAHDSISVKEYIAFIETLPMADKKLIDQPETLGKILQKPHHLMTARLEGKLVGVAKSVTDGHIFGFLSELNVAPQYLEQGLDIKLIDRIRKEHCSNTFLVSIENQNIKTNFLKLGFNQVKVGWYLPREKSVLLVPNLGASKEI